jgi:hypothetical protein
MLEEGLGGHDAVDGTEGVPPPSSLSQSNNITGGCTLSAPCIAVGEGEWRTRRVRTERFDEAK